MLGYVSTSVVTLSHIESHILAYARALSQRLFLMYVGRGGFKGCAAAGYSSGQLLPAVH